MTHVSVMLNEAMGALSIKPSGCYVDATFGRGGHSAALLKQLSLQAKLLVFDQDMTAIKCAQSLFSEDNRVHIYHHNFDQLNEVLKHLGMMSSIDGVLFDVGVSSPQLDEPQRGFSFQQDGPLDMRMNASKGATAKQWLEQHDEETIADALWRYGDEPRSRAIAAAIKQALHEQKLHTTLDLVKVVTSKIRGRRKKHPATQVFQALRVAVNDELNCLDNALEQAYQALKIGGRLVVISFHSLEHRMIKQFSRRKQGFDDVPRGMPVMNDQPKMKLIGRYKPQQLEIEQNVRARSAQLLALEKVA